jgi:hypothetical protein
LVYFWQPQAEVVEKYLLVLGGGGNAAVAKFDSFASWQDHVHHSQLAKFRENATISAIHPISEMHS